MSLANHLEMARHGAPVGPEPPLAYVEPGQAPVTEAVLDQLRTGANTIDIYHLPGRASGQ